MDASLVGAPGFKPARVVLTLSQVSSILTHLRHRIPGKYNMNAKYRF